MFVHAYSKSKEALERYDILGGPINHQFCNPSENENQIFVQYKIHSDGFKYRGYLYAIHDTNDGYGTQITPEG